VFALSRRPALAGVFLGVALVLGATTEVAAQCPPFCFEAMNSDLLLTGVPGWSSLPVAHSHGDGTFTVTNGWVGEFGIWAANPAVKRLVGDFDGNGWQDVALTGVPGWGSVPIAFSNGNGTYFVRNQPIDQFAYWASLPGVVPIVGDFNGDHLSDIALTGKSGWGSIPVALSMGPEQGFGRFLVYNEPSPSFAYWAALPGATKVAGDFNGDGLTDIALTGVAGWGSVPVAFANGFGGFAVTNMGISGAGNPINPSGTFADWSARPGVNKLPGDFNGDGRTDIALLGSCLVKHIQYAGLLYDGCAIPVAFSNGNGSFTVTAETDEVWGCSPNCPPYELPISRFVRLSEQGATVLTGDFDGNGRTDLALADQQNSSSPLGDLPVALSSGNGFFTVSHLADTPQTLHTVLTLPGARCVTGDFNGDGTTDVAITGQSSSTIPVAFSVPGSGFHITNFPVAYFPAWANNPAAVKLSGDFN
jgi:hypothetical protein